MGYTIFQVIGGLIVDKYGYNVVIYVLILISIINALYPIIINQYYLLLIVQFIMGSLLAIAYVALISMVLSNYSRGRSWRGYLPEHVLPGIIGLNNDITTIILDK